MHADPGTVELKHRQRELQQHMLHCHKLTSTCRPEGESDVVRGLPVRVGVDCPETRCLVACRSISGFTPASTSTGSAEGTILHTLEGHATCSACKGMLAVRVTSAAWLHMNK